MLISCNRLKKYIKNSDDINFETVWDAFTLKTAEVESVTHKGLDLDKCITVKITSCEKHPDSKKLSLLKVSDGKCEYDIVCGAPNVRVGLIGVLVKEGGMVSGIKIEARKLAGYMSHGMMCAVDELGIGAGHEGILELPEDTPLGVDIKELYPVEDIIVEIDNKSLTNRPDLWGHYGIAREIAAITDHELLPLELFEVENNKKDLDIKISEPELCKRYCGIKVGNLLNNKTPLDMQIFLYYAGMRSINLFVDLTNYLMLELGQPMHAFDERVVKNIDVVLAKEGDTYTTLDGEERKLSKDTLMISNGKKYFGIAGIMGGLDSEILPDTTSIFLESANFYAGNIRKSAVALGLRTEASARYEKSLDPNMCDVALKRLLYLLSKENKDMEILSNLTDIYPKKLEEKKVVLTKNDIKRYTNIKITDDEVKKMLTSLGFKVTITNDAYDIIVPTYRATKDISMDADIIEEIVRLYGYDKISEEPIIGAASSKVCEDFWDKEYNTKEYLATKWNLHEVHSYLWYDASMLEKLNIKKDGVRLLSPVKNNLLRDDLSLSLLPIIKTNLKNMNKVGIFEIGTVIINNENKRHLSIILADDDKVVANTYYQVKEIVASIFKVFKHKTIEFKKSTSASYYEKVLNIMVDKKCVGEIRLFNGVCNSYIGKKKCAVAAEIYYEVFNEIEDEKVLFKDISRYPEVELDYTIIAPLDSKYEDLEKIILENKNDLIKKFSLVDIYTDDKNKKYTIRYILGSDERTLDSKELEEFKNNFITLIKNNKLDIVE